MKERRGAAGEISSQLLHSIRLSYFVSNWFAALKLNDRIRPWPMFRGNQRVASGIGMIGLSAFVAFGERK
jgi:hypothetical protein